MSELGYVCCKAPLLATTSSAVYGLLIPVYRGVSHHSLTACTSAVYNASSASPPLDPVRKSWKESAGSIDDTGGETGCRGDTRTVPEAKLRMGAENDLDIARRRL